MMRKEKQTDKTEKKNNKIRDWLFKQDGGLGNPDYPFQRSTDLKIQR